MFGHRRLEAIKKLGRKTIPAQMINLSSIAIGEYHENELRKDFTPEERVAIVERL